MAGNPRKQQHKECRCSFPSHASAGRQSQAGWTARCFDLVDPHHLPHSFHSWSTWLVISAQPTGFTSQPVGSRQRRGKDTAPQAKATSPDHQLLRRGLYELPTAGTNHHALKTTEGVLLQFWRPEFWNQGDGKSRLPLKPLRKDLFRAFLLVSGDCWQSLSLLGVELTLISAFNFAEDFLCWVCFHMAFLQGHQSLGLPPPPQIHTTCSQGMMSAKTLCPGQSTFWGSGWTWILEGRRLPQYKCLYILILQYRACSRSRTQNFPNWMPLITGFPVCLATVPFNYHSLSFLSTGLVNHFVTFSHEKLEPNQCGMTSWWYSHSFKIHIIFLNKIWT